MDKKSETTVSPSGAATIGDATRQAKLAGARSRKARGAEVSHPSLDERGKKGRIAQAATPSTELGAWAAPADRADPVSLLEGQETSRVQELVPVRHERMGVSAFTFYRGAALLMASDLASMPRTTTLDVQLCGDAHLSNFGLFAAPDRSVVFDVNDFDETHPGPFEWDVKRLATSFVLCARSNSMSEKAGLDAARAAASSYRGAMAYYAGMREIDIWYDRVEATTVLDRLRSTPSGKKEPGKKEAKQAARIEKSVAKARSRDAWSVIAKITEVVDGRRQFLDQPPLLTRLDLDDDLAASLTGLFREYRSTLQEDRQELLKRYQVVDLGHKVVGVGSVGLMAFVALLRGRDEDDLMVLQIKQAQASVLEAYTRKSAFSKHGHRVVSGQRLIQAASDSFLGWIDGPAGRSFYVRQLRDMKWSPDPAWLTGDRLLQFAKLCGSTLARAHARSGDAVAIAAYLDGDKSFDKAISQFAGAYADQTETDFSAFTAAIDQERLAAHEDAEGGEGALAARAFTKPSSAKAP